MEELVKLNKNPEFREYMSIEEDEKKIQNSLLNESYNSGMLNGIKQEKINLVNNLLKEKVDINTISKVSGLSLDEINKL